MLRGLYGVDNNGTTLYNEDGKKLFNTKFAWLIQRLQHKLFWFIYGLRAKNSK